MRKSKLKTADLEDDFEALSLQPKAKATATAIKGDIKYSVINDATGEISVNSLTLKADVKAIELTFD